MKPYGIHADFRFCRVCLPFTAAVLRLSSPVQRLLLRLTPLPNGISVRRSRIPGYRGLPVTVSVLTPSGCGEQPPCLLYLHGGGFGFRAARYQKKLVCRYALGAGCRVVLPDYHLLPRHPWPAAQEDCFAVYRWLLRGAEAPPVDEKGIAVGGDSAGGALAALLGGMADRADLPLPCMQMLIYPVTDAEMKTDSMARFPDTPLWNAVQNARMWNMYLGDADLAARHAASPMQAALPRQIPAAYVETAEFDCLHDEGLNYADRLRKAGGRVTLRETTGTIHGYDIVAGSEIVKESVRARIAALRRAFCGEEGRAD
ncbi:MAG: alpha/beta hydrolase [Oscillospiraceae bacterium]|nr:alpha/beta hydrolase [Oscillospiraceae bacterium]